MKVNVDKEYDTLRLMQFLQSNDICISSLSYDKGVLSIEGYEDLDEDKINSLILQFDLIPIPKSELEIAQDIIKTLQDQLALQSTEFQSFMDFAFSKIPSLSE